MLPARVLEGAGIRQRFGGLAALTRVDFHVASGEIVGLIGPNGAGKTTLFNTISGLIRPTAGVVRLDGRDMTGLAAHRIARLGIGRTFQSPRLFPYLSILDHVGHPPPGRRGRAAAGTGVVRLDFRGAPAAMRCPRTWWLLLARSEVDLCLKDPGFPVDVVMTADLRTLTRVWMGDPWPRRSVPARSTRRAAVPRPRLPDLAPAEQLRPRRAGRHHGRRPVNAVESHLADHLPSGNRPPRWSTRRGRRPVRARKTTSIGRRPKC
jgi:energy-coupling factor transporter ATP-binding protein EcfA2